MKDDPYTDKIGCTTCGKSLINVDAAIIGDDWYCPDCVEPKQGRWFALFTTKDGKQRLVGPFQTGGLAAQWVADFCDSPERRIIEVTPPDFS